jgi:hypothetical protein
VSGTPDLFLALEQGMAREFSAPHQRGSATSEAAAVAIEPRSGTLRRMVLDHLRQCGAHGATDDEMQQALEMNPSTQRPRRVELVDSGLVKETSRTRRTRSGRQAAVWVIA